MKKPLWNFFIMLREQTNLLLSIDQYMYFMQCFQLLPKGHFHHYSDLRDFCKIFWLKDYEYESDFNRYFERFVNWEELKDLFEDSPSPEVVDGLPPIIPEYGTSGGTDDPLNTQPTNNPPINEEDVGESDNNGQSTESPESESSTPETLVDFELIIAEERRTVVQERQAANYTYEHLFLLDDQAIMPFKLRHFAQRLRRKVETPVKEITEELDFDLMIEKYSENRYIDEIIYQYRDSSKSNVVLFADRFGSMLAYEYIEHQLMYAINAMPDCNFEHYFFYNLPERQDSGHYLLNKVKSRKSYIRTDEHAWDSRTWFFIVSDAGAHSGMINKGRMVATLNMWNYLKKISNHVHWINPVPKQLFLGSTAHRLSLVIPMIYPIQSELNKFFQKK